MKYLKHIIILLFIIGTQINNLNAQYEKIVELLPEEYQSGIIIYPTKFDVYPEDSIIFVFKAMDYVKFIKNNKHVRKKDRFLLDELYIANSKRYTVLQYTVGEKYKYFPNKHVIIELFAKRKIIVLERKNDYFEIIEYIYNPYNDKNPICVICEKTKKRIYYYCHPFIEMCF
jgi:hypothetical protein